MNKKRRALIKHQLNLIESVKDELQNILFEEEYSYDNLPDNLKSSFKGEESEEAIDTLSDIISGLEDCIEELKTI